MPELHYRDALKRGQRETRACAATGEYPYLPVLDDFVPSERVTSGIDLGIQSIPTLYLFKDGQAVDRTVGLQGKDAIRAMIDRNR